MSLVAAFTQYLIRLVIYSAVAAGGIALGIKIRKNKNRKEDAQVEK